jgi:general nucleoside transport system ATP-binding protein
MMKFIEINREGDRIAVIYRGEFIAILDAQTATVEEMSLLIAGGDKQKIKN